MKHLAIIADGNRRWAEKNNLPKKAGYAQGLLVIENCCDWAIENNIKFLTFYCLSTENLKRSKEEVDLLMRLAHQYFDEQSDWYINKKIRVLFSGRKDRIDKTLIQKSEKLEEATKNGSSLTLTICFDYGGRDEIARAIASGARTEEEITAFLTKEVPEPDVILRTGGQLRLSNFLIWQSAYSELFFLNCYFPDLKDTDLSEINKEYYTRKRNYGR